MANRFETNNKLQLIADALGDAQNSDLIDALADIATAISQGGGGTSDYAQLTNKPQINSNVLSGNQTSAQLGLQSALTFDNTPTSGSSNPVTSDGIYDAIDTLNSKIVQFSPSTTISTYYRGNAYNTEANLSITQDGIYSFFIKNTETGTASDAMIITLKNSDGAYILALDKFGARNGEFIQSPWIYLKAGTYPCRMYLAFNDGAQSCVKAILKI